MFDKGNKKDQGGRHGDISTNNDATNLKSTGKGARSRRSGVVVEDEETADDEDDEDDQEDAQWLVCTAGARTLT